MTKVYLDHGNGRYRLFEEKLQPMAHRAAYTRPDGSEVTWDFLCTSSPEVLNALGLPFREFQEPELDERILSWVKQIRRDEQRRSAAKKRLAEVIQQQTDLEWERAALERAVEGSEVVSMAQKELATLLSKMEDAEVIA